MWMHLFLYLDLKYLHILFECFKNIRTIKRLKNVFRAVKPSLTGNKLPHICSVNYSLQQDRTSQTSGLVELQGDVGIKAEAEVVIEHV